MKRALPLVALLALAPALPRAMAADDLGRLFFTPEQRKALDARRKARVPDKPAAAIASPTVRLDGYVKRSGGKSTVWVNGEAVESPARLPESSEAPVTVSTGDGTRAARLKPGETLDRGNGDVSDVIGGGEIRVRRRAP
jgi:hypothetical protein